MENQQSLLKIFGWVLLLLGLVIITWTLFSSYNIFTGQANLPEFFKTEIKDKASSLPQKGLLEPGGMEELFQQAMGEQLKEFIPANMVADLLNLIAWSILAGILVFGGTQISGIGIKLLKK